MANTNSKAVDQGVLDSEYDSVKVIHFELNKLINHLIGLTSPEALKLKQALVHRCNKLLIELLYADSQETFEKYIEQLKALAAELTKGAKKLSETDNESIFLSISESEPIINDNIAELSRCRFPHLIQMRDWRSLGAKALWVGLGFTLIAVSAVLVFAFPGLGIPIFCFSVSSVTYGVMDFISKTYEMASKKQNDPIVERSINRETSEKLVRLSHVLNLSETEFSQLIQVARTENKAWLAEKKWFERLSISTYASGFAFTGLGILSLFLSFGIPLLGIAALITVNIFASIWGEGLIYQKVKAEERRVDSIITHIDREINENKQLINTIYKHQQPAVPLSIHKENLHLGNKLFQSIKKSVTKQVESDDDDDD
ncbi:hypothetical protein N9Q05_02800, partial [bacterium]|nr:hypothetical protein [bacterium]